MYGFKHLQMFVDMVTCKFHNELFVVSHPSARSSIFNLSCSLEITHLSAIVCLSGPEDVFITTNARLQFFKPTHRKQGEMAHPVPHNQLGSFLQQNPDTTMSPNG